jgi:hypothetical protein
MIGGDPLIDLLDCGNFVHGWRLYPFAVCLVLHLFIRG